MKSQLTKSLDKQTPLKTGDSIYPLKSKYLYMKKILVFVLVFFVNNNALVAQTDSYNSNIFTDSPISLSSGHYSFNLPLFNVETSNSLIHLQAQLSYHSKSVRSIYSGSMFGNGFSLNILPVISRTGATDEANLPNLTLGANGVNPKPDVYSYNLFGLTGKFFVYVKNGTMRVQIIEQNGFAQIKVKHDTGPGPIFNIATYQNMYFTITDKNGTEYIFNTKEIRPYQNTSQNRFLNIYLSNVRDKSMKEVLNYTYNDKVIGSNTLKQIDEITISNYGKIRFNIVNATIPYVSSIELYESNSLKQTISLQYNNSHLNTKNLVQITYKDTDNKTYYYQLLYNSYIGSLDSGGYYWQSNHSSNDYPYGMITSEFADLNLLSGMTSGALRRIILPTGGLIDFTYEVNDVAVDGNSLYNLVLANYDLLEIPKTESTVHKIENGMLVAYKRYTFTIAEKAKLFYRIKANGTTLNPGGGGGGGVIVDPGGNPVNPVNPIPPTFPDYKIYKSTNLSAPVISGKANATTYSNKVLEPGTYYLEYKNSDHSNFTERSLKIHSKKTSDLQYFMYAPGIRIKSIKETVDNKPKSETVFHYKSLAQMTDKVSSGYGGYADYYSKSSLSNLKDKNKEFVYYTAVTKEIKGKGFIEYDFGNKVLNDSLVAIGKYDNLRKFPKTIKRYDLNKNLEEEIVTTYNFEFTPMEVNENTVNVKPQGILKDQASRAKSYVNNQNNADVTKAIAFSTQYRLPLTETVNNLKTNEVTKVESNYQQLGNEILLTNVSKTVNNNLLFQRNYNYLLKQINTNTSFYHLSSFTEENKFGENINSYQVTKTDANGNVLEYQDHLGVYHSIIWGYNNGKKLCEIADLKYDDINTTTIQGLHFYTTVQLNPGMLANIFSSLRAAHPDKLITTYAYYINRRLRNVTDPNGRTTNYEYDDFGRLVNIKDHEGHLIKSYQYNYINGVN